MQMAGSRHDTIRFMTNCPVCHKPCLTENYEQASIQRCQSCEGTWVSHPAFLHIVEVHEKQFAPTLIKAALSHGFAGIPDKERKRILSCPDCRTPLAARNYEYNSGIIIDVCPQCHGIWLDADELEEAQVFEEHGEQEEAVHGAEWEQIAQKARAEVRSDLHQAYEKGLEEGKDEVLHPFSHLFNAIHPLKKTI